MANNEGTTDESTRSTRASDTTGTSRGIARGDLTAQAETEQALGVADRLARIFADADARGISPDQVLDEQRGQVLPGLGGRRCTLLRWSMRPGDERGDPVDQQLGEAHVGHMGIILYSTRDECTFVRFDDGLRIWCYTTDVRVDG